MIDIHKENVFPLSAGTHRLETRPSAASLWRWALKGLRGTKLETVLIGGRRYTSDAAFDRFVRSINEAGAALPPPTRVRAKQRAAAAKRAAKTF
jgi:hypothetical protein